MSFFLDLLDFIFEDSYHVASFEVEAKAIADWRTEKKADAEWSERRQQLAAHAQADILVLAAIHDGRISDEERVELATALPGLLLKGGVQTTPEELIARWDERQKAVNSDAELSQTIESLAHWLTEEHKRRLYETIVRLDASDDPVGPSRAGMPRTSSTVELFGHALGITSSR